MSSISFVNKVICVNPRKDNKKLVIRNAKKRNFPVKIHKPRTESFLNQSLEVLKEFVGTSGKKPNVMIYDDRLQFLLNPKGLFEPPADWELIYLNGNITQTLGNELLELDSHFTRATAEKTTCILIRGKCIDKFIKAVKAEDFSSLISYVVKNTFVVENNKAVGLEPPDIPKSLDSVPVTHSISNSGKTEMNLKLPDEGPSPRAPLLGQAPDPNTTENTNSLPKVTLITPVTSLTAADRALFYFTVLNFYNLDYPRDLIEWVIADDTPESAENQITSILPGNKDRRIKVVKCSLKETAARTQQLSLGKKLNVCLNYSSNQIILHFFERTYYSPESVKIRVKTLLSFPEKECVGCTQTGYYNFIHQTSYTSRELDPNGNETILYEPSLAYHKKFWRFRPFHEYLMNDNHKNVCIVPWSQERYQLLLTLPYQLICVALSSGKIESEKSSWNFIDTWDLKLKEALDIAKSDYLTSLGN